VSDPQPVSGFVAQCMALVNRITNDQLPKQARDEAKLELAALLAEGTKRR
jgi:hypothetical protein